ncbi:MAG: hypothetical protein PVS3B3_07350 [Ktedonobacteraceae bacterium]
MCRVRVLQTSIIADWTDRHKKLLSFSRIVSQHYITFGKYEYSPHVTSDSTWPVTLASRQVGSV